MCPDCLGEGTVICPHSKKDKWCKELGSVCTSLGSRGMNENNRCLVKCTTCKGEKTIRVPAKTHIIWVDEAKGIDKSVLTQLTIKMKEKRRKHKKYEVSSEEVHIKRGKRQRRKYQVNQGELG